MLSDLIIKLHPRKNTPNTTVSDKTHSTAICTTRMTKSLRSSCASTRDPPPSPVTTLSVPLPEYVARVPARVWLPLNSAPWVTSKKETFMFPFSLPANRHATPLRHSQHKIWTPSNSLRHVTVQIKKKKKKKAENKNMTFFKVQIYRQTSSSCVMSTSTSVKQRRIRCSQSKFLRLKVRGFLTFRESSLTALMSKTCFPSV